MKFFKDASNFVYAYESDGSQDSFIKPGLSAITEAEAEFLRIPPVIVPSVISMRQARQALNRSGFLTQVDLLIESIPGAEGEEARIEWGYATEVRRSHPLVGIIASDLLLTDGDVDDLFVLGGTL